MHYLLIDTSYLQYRSYYAYPTLTNSKNKPLGAVFGFIKSVIAFEKNVKPDFVVFAKDLSGPTFRDEFYDEYKAGRLPTPPELKEQIKLIHELLEKSQASVLALPGYEADDMIAGAAYQLVYNPLESGLFSYKKEYNTDPDPDFLKANTNPTTNKVTIFSGDRDLYQLLTFPQVEMLISDRMGSTKILDVAGFEEKYELKPAQWLDYKAMVGDSSDNIKGIPGVGPKTATSLLQEHGSLASIYNQLGIDFVAKLDHGITYTNHQTPAQNPKPIAAKMTQKLTEHLEDVILAYRLSKLAYPQINIPQQNWKLENIVDNLHDWEFKSIIKELNLETSSKPEDEAQNSLF